MFTEAAQRLDVRRQEAASRRLWVGAFTAGPQLGSGSVRVQFTAWEGSPPRDCWSGALDRALGDRFRVPRADEPAVRVAAESSAVRGARHICQFCISGTTGHQAGLPDGFACPSRA